MLRFRHKEKEKAIDEKRLGGIMKQELSAYVKRGDLQECLEIIEKDKRRKELWESLSPHKRIKVLRYALKKKGGRHAKK